MRRVDHLERPEGFVDPADQLECEDIIKNQAPEGA